MAGAATAGARTAAAPPRRRLLGPLPLPDLRLGLLLRCPARHGGSPDDYIKKGDAVTVLETGRTGVVTYGPDSDGDYKVTHTDETEFTDADALTKGDVLAKGGRVFHLEKKRAGIITYGPDSDGDYKVTFDDDQSESGYEGGRPASRVLAAWGVGELEHERRGRPGGR